VTASTHTLTRRYKSLQTGPAAPDDPATSILRAHANGAYLMAENIRKLNYARAAIESARSGLAHIVKTEPHGYLALFLSIGLITNVRAIFHVILKRETKVSSAHRDAIALWLKTQPTDMTRFKEIWARARDLLIKEFSAIPIVATSSGSTKNYSLSLYLPSRPISESVLTEDEIRDRQLASRFAAAMGGDGTTIANSIRVDIISECAAMLELWDREVAAIEAAISEALDAA